MPTAGKATGAVLFALLAFVVARMVLTGLPPSVPPGPAQQVAAVCGALTGWRIAGRRSRGVAAAAARGLTTALAAGFWTLFIGATWQMVHRSLRGIYGDPVEALGDVAALMADYARVLFDPAAATLLLVGGAAAGIAAAEVARRLP